MNIAFYKTDFNYLVKILHKSFFNNKPYVLKNGSRKISLNLIFQTVQEIAYKLCKNAEFQDHLNLI